jgi:hypothetical protein
MVTSFERDTNERLLIGFEKVVATVRLTPIDVEAGDTQNPIVSSHPPRSALDFQIFVVQVSGGHKN